MVHLNVRLKTSHYLIEEILEKKGETKKMARIWRQGDVVVREVRGIPENVTRSKSSEIRIASETGNPHVLRAALVYETPDPVGELLHEPRQQYALLEEETVLTHPEHAPLRLAPGVYRITTVRDYAPARRLLD